MKFQIVESIVPWQDSKEAKNVSIFSLTGWDTTVYEFDDTDDWPYRELNGFLRQAFGLFKIDRIQSRSQSSVLEVKAFGDKVNLEIVFCTYYLQQANVPDVDLLRKLLFMEPPQVKIQLLHKNEALDELGVQATVEYIASRLLAALQF